MTEKIMANMSEDECYRAFWKALRKGRRAENNKDEAEQRYWGLIQRRFWAAYLSYIEGQIVR